VLREICERLARDEARHFKMFHSLLVAERRGARDLLRAIAVVRRRIRDLENDQISYAFFCCDPKRPESYSTDAAAASFLPRLYALYRHAHLRYAVRLILRAMDVRLPRWAAGACAWAALAYIRFRPLLLALS
jgi:hypothetical protein